MPRQPTTHFLLTPGEIKALDALATAWQLPSRAEVVRRLLNSESIRRPRKSPQRAPAPASIPTTGKVRHFLARLTDDEIATLDTIRSHMLEFEGIDLDRYRTLRRLIHDERRRGA